MFQNLVNLAISDLSKSSTELNLTPETKGAFHLSELVAPIQRTDSSNSSKWSILSRVVCAILKQFGIQNVSQIGAFRLQNN